MSKSVSGGLLLNTLYYDANGNLTNISPGPGTLGMGLAPMGLDWNVRGELVKWTALSGTVATQEYGYDAWGERRGRTNSPAGVPGGFMYVGGTGWTPAGRLAIGNAIVTRAGPSVKIVRIETKEKPATVYNFEVRDTHSYFVGDAAKGGLATGSRTRGAGQDDGWLWVHNYPSPPDYETTFHNANPSVPRGSVNVHHAVEQQVQDLYPGRFTYAEIHAAENLRGIPRPINGPAHLSAIRKSWNRFYRANPNATRQQILDHAKLIDDEWGGNFVPVNGSLY